MIGIIVVSKIQIQNMKNQITAPCNPRSIIMGSGTRYLRIPLILHALGCEERISSLLDPSVQKLLTHVTG